MRRVKTVLALAVVAAFLCSATVEAKVFELYAKGKAFDTFGITIKPKIDKREPNREKGEQGNELLLGRLCGITVLQVRKGSLAEKAGIQNGDFITKMNGIELVGLNEVADALLEIKPNKKCTVCLVRQGARKRLEFTSDDKYYKDKNFLFLVIHRMNKFAERRDGGLILCNTKQGKNFKFFGVGVILVDVKYIGKLKETMVLLFINFREGEDAPVEI